MLLITFTPTLSPWQPPINLGIDAMPLIALPLPLFIANLPLSKGWTQQTNPLGECRVGRGVWCVS